MGLGRLYSEKALPLGTVPNRGNLKSRLLLSMGKSTIRRVSYHSADHGPRQRNVDDQIGPSGPSKPDQGTAPPTPPRCCRIAYP